MKKIACIILLTSALFSDFTGSSQNCAVNAGLDQTICVTQSLTLTGFAGNPKSIPPFYEWSLFSGPAVTITTPNATTSTVTGLTPGSYVFQLVNRCSDNILAKDYVSVTILPEPATSQAGEDVTQCTNTPVTLSGNEVIAPLTGTWTVSPAGGSFSPNNATHNATYSPPAGNNTYTLTWTVSNGYCSSADSMILKVVGPAAVSAGPDITRSCQGSTATMAASNPGLSPQSGIWSVISGPNTPVFSNINLRTSTVSNLVPGTYTLRWTVSGPCGSGSDDMVLNVTNINVAPSAGSAASYTTYCSTSGVTSQVLNANPLTAGETAAWTQTGGGTGGYPNVTFSPTTTGSSVTVNGLSSNFPYVFRYTKTNAAGCTASAVHTVYRMSSIQNLTPPADQELSCNTATTTALFVYDDLTSINTGITRVGSFVSGPSVGTIAYGSTAASAGRRTDTWNVTNLTSIGTYLFRVEYRNACGSVFNDFSVTTSRTPGDVNAGSDIILPCNTLTAIPIGTVSAPGGYTWTQISGPNTATIVNEGTSTPTMSGLIQGLYGMRLQINGGKQCAIKTDTMLVKVTQNVPVTATTDPGGTICAGSYRLNGNIPQPEETGTWTVSPSAGVSFIPNANAPNAVATGLATNTTYSFTWTVSNSCGSIASSQTVVTNGVQGPPAPDAGADLCLAAGSISSSLTGSDAGSSTLTWTALSPGSAVVSPNNRNSGITFSGGTGVYLFEYRLNTAGCNDLTDTIAVSINHATTANAGVDQDQCAASIPYTATLSGVTSAPAGAVSTWLLSSGGIANISTPSLTSTTVTDMTTGLYVFEYKIQTGSCPASTDQMIIRIAAEPSAANAGIDISQCNVTGSTNIALGATPVVTGTGYWQPISSPVGAGTATLSNAASPTSNLSGLTQGVYSLRWTVTNGPVCTDKTDDVTISIGANANAGADISYCNVSSVNLTGNGNTTGTWTLVSGPNSSTITTNSGNTATATDLISSSPYSSYIYRYSLPGYGSCAATQDDILVRVYPAPSLADGNADVELCFSQTSVTLTGVAPTTGTASWSRVSGPTPNPTAGAATVNAYDTTLNISTAGLYVYNYSVNTTSPCVASTDPVQIIKETAANAGADQRYCNTSSVTLDANAPVYYPGSWSYVSGPAGYSITNLNNPKTTVTGLTAGTYEFKWTIAGGGACTENADIMTIIIDAPVSAISAGTDVTICEGSSATIQLGAAAEVGVTYSWTPTTLLSDAAIAQPVFSGTNNAGSYTYTVRGINGTCENYDAVTVVVNTRPTPVISMTSSGCTSVNYTGLILNTGVNNPEYSWNFGLGANPATATGTGTHTVIYTNGGGDKTITLTVNSAEGCSRETSMVLNNACYGLPIRLNTFTANPVAGQNKVLLDWSCFQALDFHSFTIEKSQDGLHFINIATIDYSATVSSYKYEDNTGSEKQLYYRLKLSDLNGQFSYSPVRKVILQESERWGLWPVPFNSNLFIRLSTSQNSETFQAELSDMSGRKIKNFSITISQGEKEVEVTGLSAIPSGIYMLHLFSERQSKKFKLVKAN